MKKKGFTLIELLAVIVILGIITVIAVPKVLDIINKSKESASNSSIKLVKDAIKTQVASSDLTGPVFTKETDGCYLFNFDDQTSGNAKALEIKNKDKVTGSIKYCNNTFSDDTLKFNGNSISKGDTNKNVICKRATTLHTEECTQVSDLYYCSTAGYTTSGTKGTTTITYGNLGTSGTISSGDAFDCDVNGDGIYNPETERFYYASDYYNTSTKSFENDTAVLIYYNNVSNGSPSNSTTYAYNKAGLSFFSPKTAIQQLPTTSEWSNVSLKNTTRAILNENDENTTSGSTLPSDFSYSGYAARLLTIQEVRKAAKNDNIPTKKKGEFDNCIYLLENTKFSNNKNGSYSYWLETYYSSNGNYAYDVNGRDLYVYDSDQVYYSSNNGVRPAIEVSKTDIDY